eukprot:4193452-Amphidinium_carterae.1
MASVWLVQCNNNGLLRGFFVLQSAGIHRFLLTRLLLMDSEPSIESLAQTATSPLDNGSTCQSAVLERAVEIVQMRIHMMWPTCGSGDFHNAARERWIEKEMTTSQAVIERDHDRAKELGVTQVTITTIPESTQ